MLRTLRPWFPLPSACLLTLALMAPASAQEPPAISLAGLQRVTVESGRGKTGIALIGPESWQQLIVTGHFANKSFDLTRTATYTATPAGIVQIDANGLVTPLKEGEATLQVKAGNQQASVKVTVAQMHAEAAVSFEAHIVPILTRLGCNTGGCHGKTGGQNGFALSLFGFEPPEDHESLVKESRGRRLMPAAPANSLLLLKATGSVAHGGGKRLALDSPHYHLLRRWIALGAPYRKTDSSVTHIEVLPRNRIVERNREQQLAVIAHLSDGSTLDVTRLAQFEVNDKDLAHVSMDGLFTARGKAGSVAVMARYQTHVDVFQALVPLGAPVGNLPKPANFIDELVFKSWQELGLPPSNVCDDATFLRRVTIDIAGRLPTLDETKAFLASTGVDRHEKVVDRLLASEDYAYHFASKWSSVLRNRRKSDKDDPKITRAFHDWIKGSLHTNVPFDRFVRDVLTVSGPQTEHPQVVWYREVPKINDQVEDVAQLFLGQRITCARCHHHPFEKWSQQDYWGLAAFFSRVEFKDPPAPKKEKGMKETPARPPMVVLHKPGMAQALNPRTNAMVKPTGLGAKTLDLAPDVDPRGKLLDWMTDPSNPYFAKTLANRYWKHFFGRGLVEPEDDMRVTNPPSHPELLDGLAKSFIASKYDLKKLVRAICTSHVYRLSAEPNAHNADDLRNFTRYQPRRLSAEVLLDSIDDVTGIRSTFKGMPAGTRAIRLPDNQADSYFLSVFGRPDFASACECERSGDSNLAQSLHLVNSTDVLNKIAKGRASALVKDKRSHADKIEELYLIAFSRPASAAERQILLAYLDRNTANVQRAYEDILWSVLNTKEFMFNH